MKAILGLFITMGLVKKNSIYDYWSKLRITNTPGFIELFSRERFLQIYKCLDFEDIENKGLQM